MLIDSLESTRQTKHRLALNALEKGIGIDQLTDQFRRMFRKEYEQIEELREQNAASAPAERGETDMGEVSWRAIAWNAAEGEERRLSGLGEITAPGYTEYDKGLLKSCGISSTQLKIMQTEDGLSIPTPFAALPQAQIHQSKPIAPEIHKDPLLQNASGPFLRDQWRNILAEQGFRLRSEEGEEEWRSSNTDAQVVIDDPGNCDPFWRYYINYEFVAEGNDSSKLLFVIENREDDELVVHGKVPNDDDKKWMKLIGIETEEVRSPFGGATEKSD